MSQVKSELIYKLIDEFSKPAQEMAKSIEGMQGKLNKVDEYKKTAKGVEETRKALFRAKDTAQKYAEKLAATAKPSQKLQREAQRAASAVDTLRQSFLRQSASARGVLSELNKMGISTRRLATEESRLRAEVDKTNHAMTRQKTLATQAAHRTAARREEWRNVGAFAGLALAHKANRFGHNAFETYLEFDKERRYGAAVMNLTDEQQKPLVKQALHGGATTRFNDIQWLEGQRDLANRGLKMEQILGVMPAGANLGTAMDLSLPEAVKQMENAIFGFQKDISTTAKAIDAANRTADLQVKAAKISGMTPEDIAAVYRFGANSAHMNNMSEETLLGFGGILKKAGIGGDQGGVAFRAMMASLVSPTNKARTAMAANGLNFKNYQKAPDKLALDPFVLDVARKYGVKLDAGARNGLEKIFSNKALIADPSRFTPAVMEFLGDRLEGRDAKSLKQIAGHANAYRDASMKGVDTNKFMFDLMTRMAGNPALANAIFGSKQGGRIATALGNPEIFKKMMDELFNHSQGYAKDIADKRNEGAYGQYVILQGAIKNLMTNIGMSFDNDGKGGALTGLLKTSGKVATSLAEMDHRLLRTATTVGAVGATFVGFKSVANISKLLSGGGLSASALALDGSAAALTEAAVALGAGGRAGAAANAVSTGAGGTAGKMGRAGRAMGLIGKAVPWIYIGYLAYELAPKTDKDYRDVIDRNEKQQAAAKQAGVETPPDTTDVNVNRLNGGSDWGYITGRDIPDEIKEQLQVVDALRQTVEGGAAQIFTDKLVEAQAKLESMQNERKRYVLSKHGADYGPQIPYGPEMPSEQQNDNGVPAPGIPLPPPRPNTGEFAGAAQDAFGGFSQAMQAEIAKIDQEVQTAVARWASMLNFTAAPTISANISTTGGGPQSMSGARRADMGLDRSRQTSLRDGKSY